MLDWQALLTWKVLLIGWFLAVSVWVTVAMHRHRPSWQMASWITVAWLLFGWYSFAVLATSDSLRRIMMYIGSAFLNGVALVAVLAWARARKSR